MRIVVVPAGQTSGGSSGSGGGWTGLIGRAVQTGAHLVEGVSAYMSGQEAAHTTEQTQQGADYYSTQVTGEQRELQANVEMQQNARTAKWVYVAGAVVAVGTVAGVTYALTRRKKGAKKR